MFANKNRKTTHKQQKYTALGLMIIFVDDNSFVYYDVEMIAVGHANIVS